MFKHRYLWFSCLFVTLMSLGGAVSSASPAAIEDNGDFFSASAKAEAARNIGELEKAVHKDLAIETFKEAPADVAQEASSGDKAETNRVFEAWAEKQAKAKHVNGVYILLVKSPAHLQVLVGNDTQKRLFTLQDRETLVSTMLTSLRAKKYDEALLDAVNFVSTTMRAHAVADLRTGAAPGHVAPLGEVRRAQSGFPGWLIPVLLVVVVLWVIRVIFRGISGGSGMMGGGAPMGPMYGGGGGGGGFFSSMLGGIFGAAAGNWLYDRFTGDRGSTSSWVNQPDNQNSIDQSTSGQDTDYSGSGGSFGDDSGGNSGDTGGGGDSGGGDFGGGGDSGGGDSGGGGDF